MMGSLKNYGDIDKERRRARFAKEWGKSDEPDDGCDEPYDESKEKVPFYYMVGIWDQDNVTAMDVIDGMGWDFNYGCAFKYMVRAGRKPLGPEAKDLRKAIRCLERALMKAEA